MIPQEKGAFRLVKLAAGSLIAFAILAAACSRQEIFTKYAVRGVAEQKDAMAGEMTLKHEDIPGFMPAMTMTFKVRDRAGLGDVQPGDFVTADLIVTKNGEGSWLENLKVVDASKRGTVASESEAPKDSLDKEVEALSLINQDNKKVELGQFRGKAVLLTFIYTRCPLPDYCPLITSHFAAIERRLEKDPATYRKTHLISISIDPEYDQPPVLKKYALAYLESPASLEHWDFVTCAPGDLKKLAGEFGLFYLPDGNQVAHSMSTVLISPAGTIVKEWKDNEWTVDEVTAAVTAAAQTPAPGGLSAKKAGA